MTSITLELFSGLKLLYQMFRWNSHVVESLNTKRDREGHTNAQIMICLHILTYKADNEESKLNR